MFFLLRKAKQFKLSFTEKLSRIATARRAKYNGNLLHSHEEITLLLAFSAPVLLFVVAGLLSSLSTLSFRASSFLFTFLIPAAAVAFASVVPVFRNPVHSLLALLGLFACTALIYLSQSAEYLSLVFLIVYVGAIAILFLFVIMLLNVKDIMSSQNTKLVWGFQTYVASICGALLGLQVITTAHAGFFKAYHETLASAEQVTLTEEFQAFVTGDIQQLRCLFTTEWPLFALITVILLISMLGAIVLATTSVENDEKPSFPETKTQPVAASNEDFWLSFGLYASTLLVLIVTICIGQPPDEARCYVAWEVRR